MESKLLKYMDKLQSINYNKQHSKYNIYMNKYQQYVMKGGLCSRWCIDDEGYEYCCDNYY